MYVGIDVGSTGLKLAFYNEKGVRTVYSYREYTIKYYNDGRAEIDPAHWWESLNECVRELKGLVDMKDVSSIAISGANSMVLADQNGQPVFPAIMQLDKRGAETIELIRTERNEEELFRKTGNRIAAGYQWGPTLKWLQLHESEKLKKVRYIFDSTSYLVYRLTGVYYMDSSRAMTTLLYDAEKKQWDEELWQYFGLENVKKPEICPGNMLIGKTGKGYCFPENVPVAAGGIDTICASVGLSGGKHADVLIMGSIGRFAAVVETWDRRFLNTISWDETDKISMTPVNNAGTALKWAKNLLFSNQGYTSQITYTDMDRMAEKIAPGSERLMFIPYLNGASCPIWDETVRGTFLGIEAYHKAPHFIRAVMEGVGYTLAENHMLLEEAGNDPTRMLILGGGGAKSLVWSRMLCDILNRRIAVPEQIECETLGAAMIGGIASGTIDKGRIDGWNKIKTVLEPDPEIHQTYMELFRSFIRLYPKLKEMYEQRPVS